MTENSICQPTTSLDPGNGIITSGIINCKPSPKKCKPCAGPFDVNTSQDFFPVDFPSISRPAVSYITKACSIDFLVNPNDDFSENEILNTTPSIHDLLTPALSEIGSMEPCNLNLNHLAQVFTPMVFVTSENSIGFVVNPGGHFSANEALNSTPSINDLLTQALSEIKSTKSCILNDTACNGGCEEIFPVEKEELNGSSILTRKYISKDFCDKKDTNPQEVSQV